MKILHTADFHINAVQSGRWNPSTGLPERMMDFLKSVDTIIDTAIEEKVDLVLIAGDIYKNQSPIPAHQAAFDKRILRLEEAKIETYLLVGNHDMASSTKAHALEEFKSFNTKYIHVVDEIKSIVTPWYEILALPWIHKSHLRMGEVIGKLETLIDGMDPNTPNIFLGHCSVIGAEFSSERLIMLGEDLMVPKKLLTESGFDYVALGHIHKPQDLNEGNLPPVIYPGSIERVDWGEAGEEKGFVIAEIQESGSVSLDCRKLDTRPMLDYKILLKSKEEIHQTIYREMDKIDDGNMWKDDPGVMIRIKLQYPEQWVALINNQTIEHMFPDAFSVQIVQDPIREGRTRLDLDQDVAAYAPGELLQMWMGEKGIEDQEELMQLSRTIIGG